MAYKVSSRFPIDLTDKSDSMVTVLKKTKKEGDAFTTIPQDLGGGPPSFTLIVTLTTLKSPRSLPVREYG
jgi:hypothetical protein